jgi:hypothetical protein
MKDISKCLSRNFYQSKNIEGSVTFQLFGGDVIFDKNLHQRKKRNNQVI